MPENRFAASVFPPRRLVSEVRFSAPFSAGSRAENLHERIGAMLDVVRGFDFSADRDRIDAEWVHTMLAEHAYWAAGRSRQAQDAANAGSRCYGIYSNDVHAQVAFARVVTDGATFGWLCDVIVDPALRGMGLGKQLLSGIVADLEPLGLKRTLLATADAHGLYLRHGWGPLRNPPIWMERPA